jgi:hypothetical protein
MSSLHLREFVEQGMLAVMMLCCLLLHVLPLLYATLAEAGVVLRDPPAMHMLIQALHTREISENRMLTVSAAMSLPVSAFCCSLLFVLLLQVAC